MKTRRDSPTTGVLALIAAAAIGAGATASTADKRPAPGAEPPRVTLSHPGSQPRIDVLVDGKPFTSYIWPGTLKKPTLYPIYTGDGVVVTRGFPPAPGERVDHPHHVGLWFNYGDVNGYDFWNHSSAIVDPARLEKMGRIVHTDVTRMDDGRGHAELGVRTRWVTAQNGTPLVDEETTSSSAPRPTGCASSIARPTCGRPGRTSCSTTTRKACSACASAAPSRIRPRRAASSSTPPARSPRPRRSTPPA